MDLNTSTNPISQFPSNIPPVNKNHRREYLIIAIAFIIVAAGIIWWQIGKYYNEVGFDQSQVLIETNPEIRKIKNINNELNNIDMGNIDAEFQEIDSDLNQL